MQLPVLTVQNYDTPDHLASLLILIETVLRTKGNPNASLVDALGVFKNNKSREQSEFYTEQVEQLFIVENFDVINIIFERTPEILFLYPCAIEILWRKIVAMPNVILLANYVRAYQQLALKKHFTKPHATPLHFAAKQGATWVIDLMLQLGLSWQLLDHHKKSILDVILTHKRQQALDYLSANNLLPGLMEITSNVDLPTLTSLLTIRVEPKIIVALDLDGTLASVCSAFASWHRSFRKNGLFVRTSSGDYIIHPGGLELVRMLASMPNVELAFFSAGLKQRNIELVYGILCLALGKKRAVEVYKTCKILSREECLPYMSFLKREGFNIPENVNYKNTLFLDPNNGWTVIIDDCLGNAFPKQEGNLLFLRWNDEQQLKAFRDLRIQFKYGCRHRDPEFLRANQLYYAGGVLLAAIEMARQRDITLKDALLRLQFKMEGDAYVFDKKVAKQTKYYDKGLEAFRRVHPKACFLTGPWHATFFNRAKRFIAENQRESLSSSNQPS